MTSDIGLYVHIPFCVSKCAYCDFYSLTYNESKAAEYTKKILCEIRRWGTELRRSADTLYFGGGTPSLLKPEYIKSIIDECKKYFLLEDAEITLEINPAENLKDFLKEVAFAGVNRISVGMQSANDGELSLLSRRHRFADTIRTVSDIKSAGVDNFSLDIMLGIPGQTKASLKSSLEAALSLCPMHISTYLLTLEKGTPLFENRNNFSIPDDDEAGELYLYTCDFLRKNGFERYEISNFAKNNKYSKHNLKYWNCEEYLGLGAAAHSFIDGKRFYYERSLNDYLKNPTCIPNGNGGDFEEYLMLKMRLATGLDINEYKRLYPEINTEKLIKKIRLFQKAGLLQNIDERISLTDKGAVVSNSVISNMLLSI